MTSAKIQPSVNFFLFSFLSGSNKREGERTINREKERQNNIFISY